MVKFAVKLKIGNWGSDIMSGARTQRRVTWEFPFFFFFFSVFKKKKKEKRKARLTAINPLFRTFINFGE